MVVRLVSRRDQEQARRLVEENGFTFEENFDVLVGIFEGGELIATAARDKKIFKMICIRKEFQGGSLLGEMLTELLSSCPECTRDNFFIFTKPDRATSFEQMNFKVLVEHGELTLLEYGNGFANYLRRQRPLMQPGNNGGIVMNANPFTLGHQYLVEQAAAQVDHLYLFLVSEDRSSFPFAEREKLVREGVAHLDNVSVLETSDYAVSQVTFPSYFLKQGTDTARLQMEVDMLLFARKIAPAFGITKRFVGTEPYCETTRKYNEVMGRILAQENIEFIELERKQLDGEAISASRVRELVKKNDFEQLNRLLPDTTVSYLLSDRSRAIREKLQASSGRH